MNAHVLVLLHSRSVEIASVANSPTVSLSWQKFKAYQFGARRSSAVQISPHGRLFNKPEVGIRLQTASNFEYVRACNPVL
jgi:hypothetical protein